MRISTLFATAALCGGIWMGGLSAATVETDPVGAMAITLLGNSDTIVSVPFHRPIEFEGKIESITNIDEVNDTALITVTSSPAWAANQFVHNGDVQPNTYYVLMASGQNEGMYYTVTANGSDTLTIDTAGDDVTTIQTEDADGPGMGDIVRVIPYWTLNTLFPEGGGLPDNPSFLPISSILIPSQGAAGINRSTSATYYYYTGESSGGPGWRRVGVSPSQMFNNYVLSPDSYFIIRSRDEGDRNLVLAGAVQMTKHSTPINTIEANVDQDNSVAISVPVPLTLRDSGLVESGAFTPSSSFLPVDRLFVFDNSVRGLNKSSAGTFYYYTGESQGGPGWRRVGVAPSQIFDDYELTPGSGIIIRKRATDTPSSEFWTFTPNYLD